MTETTTTRTNGEAPSVAVTATLPASRYIVAAPELKFGDLALVRGSSYPDWDPERDYESLVRAGHLVDTLAPNLRQGPGTDPQVVQAIARLEVRLEAIEDGVERILEALGSLVGPPSPALDPAKAVGASDPARKRS